MHLKVSSGKWRPFCLSLNVLSHLVKNLNIVPGAEKHFTKRSIAKMATNHFSRLKQWHNLPNWLNWKLPQHYSLYLCWHVVYLCHMYSTGNKANLRDLIAATGLVILLKLDSNRRFVSPCELEIWWMTIKLYALGCDICDLDLWPLTLTFCMDLTLVIGNNSWKFHDDTMMGT